MENENEIITQINDTETTENNEDTDLFVEDESDGVDVEALKKEIATLKAQKEHFRKKSEKRDEKPEAQENNKVEVSLSPKDFLALTEAKISADDFDEVVRVSKALGKPINEALKDNVLVQILKNRVEERETANATQVKSARTSPKTTNETFLTKARQGDLPTKDEDIDRLSQARMEAKLNRNS